MNSKEADNIREAKDEAEYLNILESIGDKITDYGLQNRF